ncbi:hypothetical protein GCM10009788_53540 [Nocardioides humi]|uniref:Uncharacterized protein n=1 Tax=Nocardioides humi TaxID=449461 RepID=A0ABN2BPV6_9ACTN
MQNPESPPRMLLAGGVRHVWACPPGLRGYAAGLVLDWKQSGEDWWSLVTSVPSEQLAAETQWLPSRSLIARPGNPPLFGAPYQGVVCPRCGHVLVPPKE